MSSGLQTGGCEEVGSRSCYMCRYRDCRPVDFDQEKHRVDAVVLSYCRKHQDWCQILVCTFRLSRTWCRDFTLGKGQMEIAGFL